jgi:hypothetical protein
VGAGTGIDSVVLRITDCDTTQASPLMAAEVQVVGVFGGTGLPAAGDFN